MENVNTINQPASSSSSSDTKPSDEKKKKRWTLDDFDIGEWIYAKLSLEL